MPASASLKKQLKTSSKNYKELVVEDRNNAVQFQPRNQDQMSYFRNLNDPKRITYRDSLMNLHELAHIFPSFIWSITSHPDLVVCFGMNELIQLVPVDNNSVMSYDTTFCLGDFYVSFVVAPCTRFVENPIVPLAFVLHERKFQSVHATFFEHVVEKIVSNRKCYIVTDGEAGIMTAISSVLPKCTLLTCWNHLLRDVEFWLRKHQGKADDVVVYKSQVRELLECETETMLETKKQTFRSTWSDAFAQYVDSFLGARIGIAYSGYLKKCGLPGNGVSTNISESMNAMLKRFQVSMWQMKNKYSKDATAYKLCVTILSYRQFTYHLKSHVTTFVFL